MKYTLKTFFQAIIGNYKYLKEIELRENCGPLFGKWDGDSFMLYTKSSYEMQISNHEIDVLSLQKYKPGIFYLDLHSINYWYMTIEFSDGGPKKNKEYKLSDYIK